MLTSLLVAPLLKAPRTTGADFLLHQDRDDQSQPSERPVAQRMTLGLEELAMMVVLIIPILNKPWCGKHPPHLAREALEGECLVQKMDSMQNAGTRSDAPRTLQGVEHAVTEP